VLNTLHLDGKREYHSVSRAEALARRLEEEILEQPIPPGERLGTKSDLKQRFGVAAGTLNEAVRLLEMRSLVELRPGPGGGVFVASPSPRVRLSHLILGFKGGTSTIADSLAVRNSLEYLVAEDAARHHTKADLRDLERILADLAAAADDPASFLRANWALHRRMVEISPNMLLRSLYTTLLDYVESEIEEVAPDEVFQASGNVKVHRDLVAAIASRDQARVRKAIERHTPISLAAR
jgi:DNA-binding FadR family transcriptional regulator